uniref:General transcription factor II-I repeat domain-containing protein 2A-like n=1 Tax=Diabrotica virgifera virgifera TaxID=50390 RepID=A0A6P7GA77_DIAVI
MNPSKNSKVYHFHIEWEDAYFFTQVKGKCICLLCHASIAVGKKGNVERHFNSTHPKINTEYPANNSIRKEKVKQLKNQLVRQQSVLLQVSDKTKATTLVSYKVSQVIAKKKKPFEDGEFIKECFVEAANCLFEGFKNKYEIMSAINSLQLSSRTVTRRVENMSDVVSQMKTDLQRCIFFSLQFDESTDISDTSQLAIFVRMIFDDFTSKEELVKIIPLKGPTRGEDIFSSVKDYFISEYIPLQKLVGITTDGAPAFTGVHNGFIALCRKDDTFPNFLTYQCIVHQQALCGTFLNADNVMKVVVKLVNQVRAHALQRRKFRTLIAEMNLEYGELLLPTEIRWLSKEKILRRFYELLPALIAFLKERKEDYSTLEEPEWLRDFGFLTDVTGKLNELNLQLQGKEKSILQMISEVKSFIAKLELWN